jgi:hypothetical protein
MGGNGDFYDYCYETAKSVGANYDLSACGLVR